MKKITAVTLHQTGEGERVSILYSDVDGNGNIIATNQREGFIAVDEGLLADIQAVKTFCEKRLNS